MAYLVRDFTFITSLRCLMMMMRWEEATTTLQGQVDKYAKTMTELWSWFVRVKKAGNGTAKRRCIELDSPSQFPIELHRQAYTVRTERFSIIPRAADFHLQCYRKNLGKLLFTTWLVLVCYDAASGDAYQIAVMWRGIHAEPTASAYASRGSQSFLCLVLLP
jgi:hypothetical protein